MSQRERQGLALLLDERPRPVRACVSLDDLPPLAELVRRGPPTLFERPPSPTREIESANDWYFCGFVHGLLGTEMPPGTRVRWYCGERGAHEQLRLGWIHGAQQRLRAGLRKLPPVPARTDADDSDGVESEGAGDE